MRYKNKFQWNCGIEKRQWLDVDYYCCWIAYSIEFHKVDDFWFGQLSVNIIGYFFIRSKETNNMVAYTTVYTTFIFIYIAYCNARRHLQLMHGCSTELMFEEKRRKINHVSFVNVELCLCFVRVIMKILIIENEDI